MEVLLANGQGRLAAPVIAGLTPMKQLATTLFAMTEPRRREAILRLCDRCLNVWESHYPIGSRPTYQESVTGSLQILDVGLPREALASARDGKNEAEIEERYREPIVSLQDSYLEFQDSVEFAYYAIYNAFRRYALTDPVEEKLILNQALSALPESEIPNALASVIASVG